MSEGLFFLLSLSYFCRRSSRNPHFPILLLILPFSLFWEAPFLAFLLLTDVFTTNFRTTVFLCNVGRLQTCPSPFLMHRGTGACLLFWNQSSCFAEGSLSSVMLVQLFPTFFPSFLCRAPSSSRVSVSLFPLNLTTSLYLPILKIDVFSLSKESKCPIALPYFFWFSRLLCSPPSHSSFSIENSFPYFFPLFSKGNCVLRLPP